MSAFYAADLILLPFCMMCGIFTELLTVPVITTPLFQFSEMLFVEIWTSYHQKV